MRALIADSRQRVLRAVDVVQVQTNWHIGQHIVEFEQGGMQRAAYGWRLLPQLGQALSAEVGRGFDATNLRHMRAFYQAFPIRDALPPAASGGQRRSVPVDGAEIRLEATHAALVEIEKDMAVAKQKHNAFLKELGLKPLP